MAAAATAGCANAASSTDLSLDNIPCHFLASAVLSDARFELLANITTPYLNIRYIDMGINYFCVVFNLLDSADQIPSSKAALQVK